MSSVAMAPSPTTTVVDVTRSYRDSMTYQQVYMDVNDTTSIYNQTRPSRYNRFNVSKSVTLCMCYELFAVMSIQVGMFVNYGTIHYVYC